MAAVDGKPGEVGQRQPLAVLLLVTVVSQHPQPLQHVQHVKDLVLAQQVLLKTDREHHRAIRGNGIRNLREALFVVTS